MMEFIELEMDYMELTKLYLDLSKEFPIYSIEDSMGEGDYGLGLYER